MRLCYCPSCARVFFLPAEEACLCARNHVSTPWKDGKIRRYIIVERAETNRAPWVIPEVVEEREVPQQEQVES